MSHQIYFYLHPSDVVTLERAWREQVGLTVLSDHSNVDSVRVLPSLEVMDESSSRHLFFYLIRPSDLDAVIMRRVEGGVQWAVDADRSPVIEFDSCFLGAATLGRGRAYYVDRYFVSDDGFKSPRERPAGFSDWAKRVFRIAKGSLKRLGGDYVGEAALEWVASGQGQLIDGNGRPIATIPR